MLNAIGILLCVCDLEKHNGVNLHGNVILGDNRLGLEVHNLLLDGYDTGNLIQEGYQEMGACAPFCMECTQSLNNINLGLGDNPDPADEENHDDENCNHKISERSEPGCQHRTKHKFLLQILLHLQCRPAMLPGHVGCCFTA